VDGRVLSDWTAGFNWYPTYHPKLMLNAILSHRQGSSPVGIFQMRLQVAL
jgi:phosphate-selective porin